MGSQNNKGEVNLAPFSFFNAFGANPPVIAFSPAFRGTDGSPKHTFLNVQETGEFTVSVVNYAMVEQANLASAEWPEGTDEFVKAGFGKQPSVKISPPGVAESPMVMECRLLHHVDLGGKAASGNLMIGEVLLFHIKESVFVGKYPHHDRLDLVARMGGEYYCRASGSAVFSVSKPVGLGMGFDGLPQHVRNSRVLTGNHLGQLAALAVAPAADSVEEYWFTVREGIAEHRPDDLEIEFRGADQARTARATLLAAEACGDADRARELFHRFAAFCLDHKDLTTAWFAVLAPEVLPAFAPSASEVVKG